MALTSIHCYRIDNSGLLGIPVYCSLKLGGGGGGGGGGEEGIHTHTPPQAKHEIEISQTVIF